MESFVRKIISEYVGSSNEFLALWRCGVIESCDFKMLDATITNREMNKRYFFTAENIRKDKTKIPFSEL